MGVPEHIRNRNSADVVLPSGLKGHVTLPPARELMLDGDMAWPLLERLAELDKNGEATSKGEELTADERRELYAFQRRGVARTLDAIEGETVELDPDDLTWLDDADFFQVVKWYMRAEPLPGKAE